MKELTTITRHNSVHGERTTAWYRQGHDVQAWQVEALEGHTPLVGCVDYITVLVDLLRLSQRGAPSHRANAATARQWLEGVWGPAWAGLVDIRNAGSRHPAVQRSGQLVACHGMWVTLPYGLPSRADKLLERTAGLIVHHLGQTPAATEDLIARVAIGLMQWLDAHPGQLPLAERVCLDAVVREVQDSAIAELLPQLAVDRLEWVTAAA